MKPSLPTPSRRAVLQAGGAGVFLLALDFGKRLEARTSPASGAAVWSANAFLRFDADGGITFIAKHDEMGQGIHTGLAIACAEELEVPVARLNVESAPADQRYGNSAYVLQVTGGSTSTWSSFDQMREAGAVARTMLIAAAAERWGTDASALEARDGVVRALDDSRSATYAELVDDAARQPVPTGVRLKSTDQFRQIGRPTPRVDSAEKVRGTGIFSLDQRREGMLIASIERAPILGGTVESFDATAAKAIPGVVDVFQVPAGVAVLATGYWPAFKGRKALSIEWNDGPAALVDTERMRAEYEALAAKPGLVARDDGAVDDVMADCDETLEAMYEVPFQAHVPMEPLSCMVTMNDDGGAHIVTGSQMLGADHMAVAARLGVEMEQITFENSLLGGGFGRRANPQADFTIDAIEVALASGRKGTPIKTVWAREDDITGGWYRPMFVNGVAAGLKDGKLQAWRHRIVGQSIAVGTAFEGAMVVNGIDNASVEGAYDMPHGVPNLRVELHTTDIPVTVQWWRSVGHSNTAFAKECFLDECAHALGRDPLEFQRELLEGHDRLLGVLNTAAEKSGWGSPLPEGRARGIAVHESFKGFAAHVVEASVEDGRPRVHRVTVAIDCGLAVNPDQVIAQMEGATNFALSSALEGEITFTDGRVDQSNFDTFRVVRMDQAPAVDVHIVDSGGEMGGIGEVGVPPVASALCNALFAATGQRIRRLPVGNQLA